jgi:hypothetical protein
MSPNWLNVAGCDVLSTEGAKVPTLFDIQHTKDILPITGTKTNHPKRWGWLVEEETPFPTNSPHSKVTNFFL